MEEAIKQELAALCREIQNEEATKSLDHYLRKTQLLQEKLVLLRYLKHREDDFGTPGDFTEENKELDREIEKIHNEAETQQRETEGRMAEVPSPGTYSGVPAPTGMPDEPPAETSNQQQQAPASPQANEPAQETAAPPSEAPVSPEKLKEDRPPQEAPQAPQREHEKPLEKKRSVNEQFVGGNIKLGLNDRIAFVKHLFGGSQEDLNRVVSQLNTFDSYQEAEHFLAEMVKPDYDWRDKEEYEERLQELVRARFGEQAE